MFPVRTRWGQNTTPQESVFGIGLPVPSIDMIIKCISFIHSFLSHCSLLLDEPYEGFITVTGSASQGIDSDGWGES